MIKFYPSRMGRQSSLRLFFLFFSLCILLSSTAQDYRKIDPVLSYVLQHPKDEKALATFAGLYNVMPTEGYAAPGAPKEKRLNVIVYTTKGAALRDSGFVINSVLPTFATAWVTTDQITRLSYMKEVKQIAVVELDFLHNDVARGNAGVDMLHNGALNSSPYKGKGVIVAVYDTGIDWDHADFRDPNDPTKSRIIRMWDQTITAIGAEAPPSGYSYGVEYLQSHFNDELDGSPSGFVRENDINGHGTHTAGTSAGNGAARADRKYAGMAPEADIVIIKGGNSSFPTNNSVDAITYLQGLSASLGKPVVLNMSIGGLAGAHDGTRPHELAADAFTTSGPGRVIVISAGNDNGSLVHKELLIPGSGTAQIDFNVPNATNTDIFRFRTYTSDADPLSAVLTVPGGQTVSVSADQNMTGDVISNSWRVYLYNQMDIANGHRYIEVYIQRIATGFSPQGTWSLAITNSAASSKLMHGWINYKNTSFGAVTVTGGDNNYMVGSPGTASSAITVAAYGGRTTWNTASGATYVYTFEIQDNIASFSSWGPRRDNVQKPDISAVGEVVISCQSSDAGVPAVNNAIETGLYVKNQGTSMSAPVVTGSVALLLQISPTSTAVQIKNAIRSTANEDAMTGPTNTTPSIVWGYGKINTFRAASTLASSCLTATSRTYQYDASQVYTADNGIAMTAEQVAVRFTPDVTGKIGGLFFYPFTTKAAMVAELRTSNAGIPGTLLGTISIPVARVMTYSWNYIDLSLLNVQATSGVDYFVVIKRDPGSTDGWSLRRENSALDNRSLVSTDGVSWNNPGYDYKIRTIVYRTAQDFAAIANTSSTRAQDINTGRQFFNGSCQLIAKVDPANASPVTGSINSRVFVLGGAQTSNGITYVGRHYDIEPSTNAATATARVTLYFKQQEFTDFNNAPGSVLDLPTGPGDATGIANLRVAQYHGNSTSGAFGSYSGAKEIIDPVDSDITWDAIRSCWSVSFNVTGFSGFFIQTSTQLLPVRLEYFTGSKQGSAHLLKWKVACTQTAGVRFDVERSADGLNFSNKGVVTGTQLDCGNEFKFTDTDPLIGANYYRIKITEDNGRSFYTNTILLSTDGRPVTSLQPTIIQPNESVIINFVGTKGSVQIHDAAGKLVYTRNIVRGVTSFPWTQQTGGMYFYTITDELGKTVKGKLIVK